MTCTPIASGTPSSQNEHVIAITDDTIADDHIIDENVRLLFYTRLRRVSFKNQHPPLLPLRIRIDLRNDRCWIQ